MVQRQLGKKLGMTQRFDDEGNLVPCTVVQVGPCVVTQVKTMASDGYNAVQLGFCPVTAKDPRRQEKRVSKPLAGHFKKANVPAQRHLMEMRVEDPENYEVGQVLDLGMFEGDELLDVCGTSKGKGFQGVMKLHNFSGGPAAHGSKFHRSAGSTGCRSTPGRCLPGGPRASRMGGDRVTVHNLKVFARDEERNLIYFKGAIPGPNKGLVCVSKPIKVKVKKSA